MISQLSPIQDKAFRCWLYPVQADVLRPRMQDNLSRLAAWEKKWGMAFHPEKCSAIRVNTLKDHKLDIEVSDLFVFRDLWFICFPWWSIDGLENLHAYRTTVCFEPWRKPRARLGSRKTGLSPPPPQYFNTDRSKAVPLLWLLTVTYSCCQYLYFGSAIMLVTYFSKF